MRSGCYRPAVEVGEPAGRIGDEGGECHATVGCISKRDVAGRVECKHVANDVRPDPSRCCCPVMCFLRRCRQGAEQIAKQSRVVGVGVEVLVDGCIIAISGQRQKGACADESVRPPRIRVPAVLAGK